MTFSRLATMSVRCALVTAICLQAPSSQAASANGDQQFLLAATQSDMNEIRLSQLAQTKASSPDVKTFADKMIKDHNKLENKMMPFVLKWDLPPANGIDADHQNVYDHLNGLSGVEFDKLYVSAMVADHQKALDAFTAESQSAQDSKFRSVVTKNKSVIADHLAMAQALQARL
jgi:putative membrane protein